MDAVNAHPALIALNLLPLANKDPSKINRTDIALMLNHIYKR